MSEATDNRAVALAHARMLCSLSRYADASAALDQVIASDPENGDAWCLRSVAALGLGDADAALKAASEAVALAPNEEWPHRLASVALVRLTRNEEATWHAREAVRLDPRGWRAHANLARTLTHKKATHLHSVRTLRPKAPDHSEARAAAERALELAPSEVESHMAAGAVAAAEKRRADAEAAFSRALAIDPENAGAHNELARLKYGRHTANKPATLAEAAGGFATAVRVNPRADVSRRNLDLVLRTFLSRAAYFVFVDAWFVAEVTSKTTATAARIIPVAALAIPITYAARFVAHLTPALRQYVRDLVFSDIKIGAAVALESLAAASLIAGGLAPGNAGRLFAVMAFIAALIGRLILVTQHEHSARAARGLSARPALRTPILWALSAMFVLLTALSVAYATASSQLNIGGVVAAAICAAATAATLATIKRRRSRG